MRSEAEELAKRAEKQYKEAKELSSEMKGLETRRKKAMENHRKLKKKLKEFNAHFKRQETDFKVIDGDAEVLVLEIVCFRVENHEKPKLSHIVDDGGDPPFYCPHCETSYNHCSMTDKYTWEDDDHKMRLLGKVKVSKLRELLLQK